MKTPKYNIGQKVWVIINNKIIEKPVRGIITVEDQFYQKTFLYQLDLIQDFHNSCYKINVSDFLYEDKLFETKEDLINSI